MTVGKEIDLDRGHDFHKDIIRAMKETQNFIESHKTVIKAITDGLSVIDLEVATENMEDQE